MLSRDTGLELDELRRVAVVRDEWRKLCDLLANVVYISYLSAIHDPVEKKMKEGKRRKKRLLYLHLKLSLGLVPL